MEMSGALTKVLPRQCGGNTRGLLYIDKKGSEMKNSRLRGKTAVVLPTSSPRRVGLLARICWTKSQSPRYSPGLGGPWLQMTSAIGEPHHENQSFAYAKTKKQISCTVTA